MTRGARQRRWPAASLQPMRSWSFAVLLVLFPIYWMIVTSLKLPREIYRMPSLWPHALTLEQLRELIADKGFLDRRPQQLHRRDRRSR